MTKGFFSSANEPTVRCLTALPQSVSEQMETLAKRYRWSKSQTIAVFVQAGLTAWSMVVEGGISSAQGKESISELFAFKR